MNWEGGENLAALAIITLYLTVPRPIAETLGVKSGSMIQPRIDTHLQLSVNQFCAPTWIPSHGMFLPLGGRPLIPILLALHIVHRLVRVDTRRKKGKIRRRRRDVNPVVLLVLGVKSPTNHIGNSSLRDSHTLDPKWLAKLYATLV